VILADAIVDALQVRGEGDAAAAQIYARAYSKNPEFYAFYRSLQLTSAPSARTVICWW